MACIWCMKAQVVKMTAMAFHRWKTVSIIDTDINKKKKLLESFGNMPYDALNGNGNTSGNGNGINGNGKNSMQAAAAAAAQYFQHLMSQIPLDDNINNSNNNNDNNNNGDSSGNANQDNNFNNYSNSYSPPYQDATNKKGKVQKFTLQSL